MSFQGRCVKPSLAGRPQWTDGKRADFQPRPLADRPRKRRRGRGAEETVDASLLEERFPRV